MHVASPRRWYLQCKCAALLRRTRAKYSVSEACDHEEALRITTLSCYCPGDDTKTPSSPLNIERQNFVAMTVLGHYSATSSSMNIP